MNFNINIDNIIGNLGPDIGRYYRVLVSYLSISNPDTILLTYIGISRYLKPWLKT